MAGDRKWSGASLQPHELDQLHLPAALRTVLAVGTRRGWAAHPPRRRRWSTTTGRLSRTASSHDDAEPIATCGSSALSEDLCIPARIPQCRQPHCSTLPENAELGARDGYKSATCSTGGAFATAIAPAERWSSDFARACTVERYRGDGPSGSLRGRPDTSITETSRACAS
jgi:hypothetical protein